MRRSRRAFTLVEVTLAVVVLALGILALLGLGHLAMNNAKSLEDDTRAAMLAEDLFATLRAHSETLCVSNNPALWGSFWAAFAAGETNLPLTLAHATCFSNAVAEADNQRITAGEEHALHLWSRPDVHGSALSMPEWSARWSLNLQIPEEAIAAGTNLVYVTLHIKSGLHGDGAGRIFYTHLAEHGTMP
jgi:Tfp pilus assembly protein PilV